MRRVTRVHAQLLSACAIVLGAIAVAAPAGATVTPPRILSFTASKTTLPHSGGAVTIKASVSGGSTTCIFSSTPKVSGYTGSAACASGFSKSVTLPADKTGNPAVFTFNLTVTNTAGSVLGAPVRVTVGAAPSPVTITWANSPAEINFGDQAVDVQASPLEVFVTNNSSSLSQTISSVSVPASSTSNASDFAVSDDSCRSLSPSQSCTFSLTFTPTGSSVRTADVAVFDRSWGTSGTSVTAPVEGTGVFSAASLSSSNLTGTSPPVMNFPDQGVNTASDTQNIVVTNSASPVSSSSYVPPLDILGISTAGNNASDFTVSKGTCAYGKPYGAGQSCSFAVKFTPSGEGPRTTDVVIFDNAQNFETEVQLTGSGKFGALSISIAGAGAQGSSTTSPVAWTWNTSTYSASSHTGGLEGAVVTITNTSTVDFVTTSYAMLLGNPGDFTVSDANSCVTSNGSLELLPGQSCEFSISWLPRSWGTRSTNLYIYDNSIASYDEIQMTGIATETA